MALDATKVRVGVTGLVSAGLTSATAPTGTGSTLTGFTDLGYVSEDGVSVSLPDSGDSTPIKAWQNGATVRTINATTEDVPQITLTLLETKPEVLALYYGVDVSGQTSTDGAFVVDSSTVRPYKSFVVDVVDGTNLKRIYVPQGYVSSVGEQVYANEEAVGYQVTIDCNRDGTKGFNLKVWDTAAKS